MEDYFEGAARSRHGGWANRKNVTLAVFWEYDKTNKIYKRNAHLGVLRADTGGTNLW